MIVGTGGSGLRERSWKRRALEEATQPSEAAEYELYQKGNIQHGPMRAMCFATDLARQHMLATREISSDYSEQTEDGKNRSAAFYQRLNNSLEQNGYERVTELTEKPETRMSQYAERHPEDWMLRFEVFQLANRNCLELGQHLRPVDKWKRNESPTIRAYC